MEVGLRLLNKLRKKLGYLSPEHISSIEEAYLMALAAHKGQKRYTGEAYINHPVAVACLLAEMKMDYQTVIAALLHDVIEDTPLEKSNIEEKFGHVVADLVDGVSKLTQIEFVNRIQAQAENFRKMVLAMAHDVRVIIVKLADRLHNMRTLATLPTPKRRRIARETLEIFAPIAKRLGMRDLSVELEELGFSALYPNRYRILKEAVLKARGNRKKILVVMEKTLHEKLSQSHLPSYSISGREKHLYSIYRKMRHKHVPFDEIMDVYAFRIIVDSVDSCYRALGVVHSLFKPVPERFKDYIAIAKANGYRSLHTTLFGPYGLPIEVQIRTADMDRIANRGIAAHWLYKSDDDELPVESQLKTKAWMKNLLELQHTTGNPSEFIENLKMDLFPNEVYVFTPKGEILELPAGATGVDFAYAVHTAIGNHCVAIKIDRQLAPLSTPLANGQTVEVITSERARPNPAWLDFVVTSKARSSIRHFLKTQKRTESIALGKRLLKKALAFHNLSLKKISAPLLDIVLKESHLTSLEDLLEDIGLGNRVSALVAGRIAATSQTIAPHDTPPLETKPLLIKGTEGQVLNFAACCYPVPGDPIIGILLAGTGILVHNERCRRITKLQRRAEDFIPLRWAKQTAMEFPALIRLEVNNERGILGVLASTISAAEANIEDVYVERKVGLYYIIGFKIHVRHRNHLAEVLRRLRHIDQVIKIMRR